MNVEMMAVKDIKPFERNAKKHDEKQIKNVMESIKQFGIAQPLAVDKDNVLIIGHCRLIACKRLKMDKVPVVKMDELTQEQVDKLRLLDNKLNESEWDFDLLNEDIPTLDWEGFDIDWKLPEDKEEPDDVEHSTLTDKFIDNGLKTYNELILVEQSGTGALRAKKQFGSLRKVIKTHQNVLVFYKGDIKAIKDNYTEISVDDLGDETDG